MNQTTVIIRAPLVTSAKDLGNDSTASYNMHGGKTVCAVLFKNSLHQMDYLKEALTLQVQVF